MNEMYLGQTNDAILGQEFLTWLWFCSENRPLEFHNKKGEPFTLSVEQRIVVQGGEGESLETASVSGSLSQLREARLGLKTGKKVTRALVCFEKDEMTWRLTLKDQDFALGSLKTPKVEHEKDDDPDALFLEKFYLVEMCLDMLDSCYLTFLGIRLSNRWPDEVQEMTRWIELQ